MKIQKQNGFTLIELVVVIIILGILAVTAAPKFINLQSDARKSTLDGMKGAIQGANSLVYSKAALAGEEREGSPTAAAADTGSVDIGTGTNAATNYGYLQSTFSELENALDVSISPSGSTDTGYDANAEWFVIAPTNGASPAKIFQANSATESDNTKECYVTYTPANSLTSSPSYVVSGDDC